MHLLNLRDGEPGLLERRLAAGLAELTSAVVDAHGQHALERRDDRRLGAGGEQVREIAHRNAQRAHVGNARCKQPVGLGFWRGRFWRGETSRGVGSAPSAVERRVLGRVSDACFAGGGTLGGRSGGGEDKHPLQVPRHGPEAPLGPHFVRDCSIGAIQAEDALRRLVFPSQRDQAGACVLHTNWLSGPVTQYMPLPSSQNELPGCGAKPHAVAASQMCSLPGSGP